MSSEATRVVAAPPTAQRARFRGMIDDRRRREGADEAWRVPVVQQAPNSPTTDPTSEVADAIGRPWPLVGRAGLVERVLDGFGAGTAGAVLTGPAGVGKSRLARSIVSRLHLEGVPTEWIQSTEASRDLPLHAFARLLPEDADRSTPLDLLRRITAQLQATGGSGRLVLAVDDAHLLDAVSATLVHQLAAGGEVFVLATVRTGEVTPDAVVALWKDGLTPRIDVDELDVDAVEQVLRSALGGEVEVATAHRLWAITRGNALFLHEAVLAGLASGSLSHRADAWRWRGAVTGSGKLRDLLETRLRPLAADRRRRSSSSRWVSPSASTSSNGWSGSRWSTSWSASSSWSSAGTSAGRRPPWPTPSTATSCAPA